jgi:predicted DNA-binding transcriptional regulator AlpA
MWSTGAATVARHTASIGDKEGTMAQPRNRQAADEPSLLSMPEIAALAGVRRPVVTTWRRRHPHFPEPVTIRDGRPVFDAVEICDWLARTGRADRAELEVARHLHAVAKLAQGGDDVDAIAAATALVCLRHLDDGLLIDGDLIKRAREVDPHDTFLLGEVRTLPGEVRWMAAAVDDLVEAAWSCSGAFERIMDARARLRVDALTRDAVAPELARLMSGLSGARERAGRGPSILIADPYARAGDLLAAVVRFLGPDHPPAVVAATTDETLARFIRRRLLVHGVVPGELKVSAALDAVPDVVVTALEYQPQETRSALDVIAAVDEIQLGLAPGRTAVVLGPADALVGSLSPFSPAERLRSGILSSGVVEAAIRLPGALFPFRPGYGAALWVMTRSGRTRGRMLVADVSARPLTRAVADALIGDVAAWRTDSRPGAHANAVCIEETIRALVDRPRALTARRRPTLRQVIEDVPVTVARVTELETALAEATIGERPAVRTGLAATTVTPRTTRTIGSLVREGRLVLISGTRIASTDVHSGTGHPVLGAAEVCGHLPFGSRAIDRAALADRYPRARLTEPGDVVVTTSPEFGVLVDHDGLKALQFPVRAIRVPRDERATFTPRVLAALISAGRDGLRPVGAVRPARRLEDWELPVLGAELTARLDRLLENLDARRRVAERELDLLDQLNRIAITGLTDGTLTV